MKNNRYINTSLSYSFITLLDEYLKVLNNTLYNSIKYFDNDIEHILDETSSLFLALPDILKNELWSKEDCVHKILSFKAILENKYRILTAYLREVEHLYMHSFFSDNKSEDSNTPINTDDVDFNQLISDCTTFIYSSTSLSERHQKAALFLPYIPAKMTVESFMKYVKKSIRYIYINTHFEDEKLLVSILKQLFRGSLYEDYGKDFNDISISIEELKTEQDQELFDENAQLLSETIDTLLSLISNLYRVLCCFANLLILDHMSFEDIHKSHISFYDLYCSVKSILTNQENKQLFLASLPDRIEDIHNQISVSYQKACKEVKQGDIYSLFLLMQTYLHMDVSKLFMFDIRRPKESTDETLGLFEDFLEDLKQELLSLNAVERQLRIQYFISVIPFIMSKNTFTAYLGSGINKTPYLTQKLSIGSHLESILEDVGFFDSSSKN